MADQESVHDRLIRLRELIATARSMPMSASCVVNRADVLAAVDAVAAALPDEIAEAHSVLERAQHAITEGEAEADRIRADARDEAVSLAQHSEVLRVAEEEAAAITAHARSEAEALRRETDAFIDARMASFESVLHKTSSQVKVARARLAERSGLEGHTLDAGGPAAVTVEAD